MKIKFKRVSLNLGLFLFVGKLAIHFSDSSRQGFRSFSRLCEGKNTLEWFCGTRILKMPG